jgi:ATP-dependent DNA helicase DinG
MTPEPDKTKTDFLTEFFAPGGRLAKSHDSYEHRDVQARMAAAVAQSLNKRRHLAVEAGTGVGKSFAYLIPIIEHAVETSEKALVSTHTISLQEQLIEKDIPFVSKIMDRDFNAVLAKGRSNYICPRRLDMAARRHDGLFSSKEEVDELWKLQEWAHKTKDGSLADYPGEPMYRVWSLVQSDPYHCSGRSCKFAQRCFYQKMRKSMYSADLIVANHALFFTHLKLEEEGSSYFPALGAAVLDEAHTIESVASEHMGINLTRYSLERILNGLLNEKTGRGLLKTAGISDMDDGLDALRVKIRVFFDEVATWHDEHKRDPRLGPEGLPANELSAAFGSLRSALKDTLPRFKETDIETDIEGYVKRCGDAAATLTEFVEPGRDVNFVYWVEHSGKRTALRSAPVHVGPILSGILWEKIRPVILTSATLAVGKARSFGFLFERLGLKDADSLLLGSTFDYKKQVTLHIERSMPDPREAAFPMAVADAVKRYVGETRGNAFVLFTSYRLLDEVYETLEEFFKEADLPVLRQGGGLSRTAMLDRFKNTPGSVLFGTSSFWEGVDVPGVALSNVIITRLPFSVPTTPLALARKEDMERRGLNHFMQYALPEAVIRFKQGFGRLIRKKDDKGIVVVLDSRVLTKRYGRVFLESIPECGVKDK